MEWMIGLVFCMALLPGIGPNVNVIFFYLSPLRVGILCMLSVYALLYIRRKNNRILALPRENKYSVLFMVLWFLYSLLSILWVKDLAAWIHVEYFLGLAALCTVIFSLSNISLHGFYRIFHMVSVVVFVQNIIGWFEVITKRYYFAPIERIERMRAYRTYYPISTFVNQNDYALFLLFGVCVSGMLIYMCRQKLLKLMNLLLCISCITLILRTGSRGALLGLLFGIFVTWLVCFSGKLKAITASLAILGVAMLCIIFPQRIIDLIGSFQPMPELNLHYAHLSSDAVRYNLLRNGLEFLQQTWGRGVGSGNVEFWMQHYAVHNTRGFLNMHHWWMENLTNFGVFFFVSYITFYCHIFYSLYKTIKKNFNRYYKGIASIFLIFHSVYAVASISSSSNFSTEWLWIFWALMIAFQGIGHAQIEAEDSEVKHEC